MNKNINLIEILKDIPEGTKLWSPLCGECFFANINTNSVFSITVICYKDYNNRTFTFTKEGYYCIDGVECLLFPSKNNRDWSTFKAPWKHKHFTPAQKVLVKTHDSESARTIWTLSLYSCCVSEDNRCHYTVAGMWYNDSEIIPYEGNENKLGKPVK